MEKQKLSKLALDDVRHYAEVTYPEGSSTVWYQDQEVAERALDQIEFFEGATSFKFYDKVFRKQNVNGQIVNAPAERRNDGNRTWIGKFFTLAQIADLYGKDSAIYRDLKDNNYIGRVRTMRGYAYGVGPSDLVIDPSLIKFKNKAKEEPANNKTETLDIDWEAFSEHARATMQANRAREIEAENNLGQDIYCL